MNCCTDDILKADEAEIIEMDHRDAPKRQHRLEVIKTLGEGTHGKVVLANDPVSMQQFAVKMITKKSLNSDRDRFHIQREIDIQSKLRHPHVISVYEVYETDSTVTLVMEYASGGELFDYINSQTELVNDDSHYSTHLGGLDESKARQLFCQLVSAVQYLHENGVVHRDLKLENILLDDRGNAKLADFGLSTTFGHGHLLKTYCGSPLYASPEIVNARPYVGPEVDCWSLGVLLYAMLYGTMPFDGHDFRSLRRQITDGLIQQPDTLSGAHDLIVHILEPSLHQRATLRDISVHPWLRDPSEPSSSPCPVYRSGYDDIKPSVDGCRDTGSRVPECKKKQMPSYSDNCRTLSAIAVASSFYDSLSVRESGVEPVSISDSCSPNFISLDISSHPVQDKIISEDYIPLSDSGAADLRLSADITLNKHSEDFRHTAGDGFSNQLISTPRGPSDFCFQPNSSCISHNHLSSNYNRMSNTDCVIFSNMPSSVAKSRDHVATKLPISYSADSLELSAHSRHNDNNSIDTSCGDDHLDCDGTEVKDLLDDSDDDGSDNAEAKNAACGSYDFADIDAVLDYIVGDVSGTAADVDASSQVSHDSLEDHV